LTAATWLYRYEHTSEPWVLCISTQAAPQSEAFSLGGFRIVPAERADQAGYDNDCEALKLANDMTKKVAWSRMFGIAGPLSKPHLNRVVGGKCVLLPTKSARIGKPQDRELLDFAIRCMQDFEESAGILLTTGQDLGHGTMSDGSTYSCRYLNERFPSSILADTSEPTAAGNYFILRGIMNALKMPLSSSSIGLIGCGNIGGHILRKLKQQGCQLAVLESDPQRRAQIKGEGVPVYALSDRELFFRRPLHGLAINASGGSLDRHTVDLIVKNNALRVVTGCENLMMTDTEGVNKLATAGKIFCPPEICGMMGYLTAIEERQAGLQGVPFACGALINAARELESVAERVTFLIVAEDCKITFEDASRHLYA
jgi:hypothetical protein